MTVLDRLATSDTPVVMELIATHDALASVIVGTPWDNRHTWDNWNKRQYPATELPR